jgi:DNA-binding NarL/FixJ family response regulator
MALFYIEGMDDLNSAAANEIITILLADDHPLIRHSLRNIIEKQLDFKILGEAANGREAIDLAEKLSPDIIIMDITMPVMDGLEATREIKAKKPGIGILVLTVHTEDEIIIGLFEAGADGYLIKSVFGDEVIQAIRALKKGDTVISPLVLKRILKYASQNRIQPFAINERSKLTVKEQEILRLVARGLSNKEIAQKLGISIPGVKSHLVSIFSKLNTNSRFETIIESLRIGILSVEDLKNR